MMRKYGKLGLIFILLLVILCLTCVSCVKKDAPAEEEPQPETGVVYDLEIAEEKYLKEKISDATSIYYKSNADGEFGDENALFERTLLPDRYVEMEYIQSNGVQCIDTGIPATEDLRFDLKFSDYVTTANGGGIFGTEGWLYSLSRSAKTRLLWCGERGKSFSYNSFSPYKYYVVQCGKDYFTINDTKTLSKSESLEIKGTRNVTLFRSKEGYSSVKLYYFKIYDGETLVRDFVPCSRKYDGAVGLYDLVGGWFYSVSEEQAEVESTQVETEIELPSEYRRIAYVEAAGKQKTELNLKLRGSYAVEATFAITNTKVNSAIWCARGTDSYDHTFTAYYIKNAEIRGDYGETNAVQKNVGRLSEGTKHSLRFFGGRWFFDELAVVSVTPHDFETGSEVSLFAAHYGGLTENLSAYAYMRLYSFTVCDAGATVLMHLVPSCRIEDGEAGLFDVVTGVFYTSTGKEPFIAGETDVPEKEPTSPFLDWDYGNIVLPGNYHMVEYVEGTGTQYFDTGVTIEKEDQVVYETRMQFTSTTQYYNGARYYMPFRFENVHALEVIDLRITYDGMREDIYDGTIRVNSLDRSAHFVKKNKLCILAMGDGNDKVYSSAPQPGRVYSAKLIKNDELVMYLVPCVRELDGEAGLYDLVTQTFLANAGAGKVLYGKEIESIPVEYETVEYIEYTGTQAIALPFAPSAEMTMEAILSAETEGRDIFSIVTAGAISLRMEESKVVYDAFGTRLTGDFPGTNRKFSVRASFDEEHPLSINDVATEGAILFGEGSEAITLFGQADRLNGKIKVYRIRMTEGDHLLYDFIPCSRKEDGKIGLYESIGGVFYPSTTNDFACSVSFEAGRIRNRFEEIECVEFDDEHTLDLSFDGEVVFTFDLCFDADKSSGTMGYLESENRWSIGEGTYRLGGETSPAPGGRDTLVDAYGASVVRTLNGTVVATIPSAGESGVYRIGNARSDTREYAAMKLYHVTVEKEGVIVLDLIPVLKKSDGSIGFLDKITHTFYAIYDNQKNFTAGGIVGHYFTESRVIAERSERQDGEIIRICSICGKEIHEHIVATAFKAEFEHKEGVKEIKVFKGYDLGEYEVTDVAYTRNKNTNNYSRVDGQIWFEIVTEEGYEVESIYAEGAVCTRYEGDIYVLSAMRSDSTVCVLARKRSS